MKPILYFGLMPSTVSRYLVLQTAFWCLMLRLVCLQGELTGGLLIGRIELNFDQVNDLPHEYKKQDCYGPVEISQGL